MSISSTGQIQLGGGTSIYRNVGILPTTMCPKYLSAAPLYDNTYLVGYASATKTTSDLRVVQYDPTTKKATTLAAASATQMIDAYATTTLSQSTGLFVTIAQNQVSDKAGAYLVAGRSDKGKDYQLTFGEKKMYTQGYSLSPSITALSKTTFAIAYYNSSFVVRDDGNWEALYSHASTQLGTVDPVTLAITLSPPQVITPNPTFSVTMVLAPIDMYQYVAVWSDTSCATCNGAYASTGPLNAVVVSGVADGGKSLVVGKAAKFSTSYAYGFIDVTSLDSNNVVVAYTDATSNFGVSCVVINVDATKNTIYFGSKMSITTGMTQTAFNYIQMNMGTSITTIADGSQFMVLFSDLNNKGAMTASIGKLTIAKQLIRSSPNFLLNSGNPDVSLYYSWGALAVGSRNTYASQVAIFSALTKNEAGGKCDNTASTDFSVMEIKPRPIGVVTADVVSSSASLASGAVAVSGTVNGFSNLVVGKMYYTNTAGQLVADGNFYGRDGLTSNAAIDEFHYVFDAANNVIVTVDSQIGVAVSSDTIVLRLP